jgi:manganese transport protein
MRLPHPEPQVVPGAGDAGWRFKRPSPSLPESFRTVKIPRGGPWWRKALAFAGPGYMVAVGYMDPGNWATDLAGGAQFGYALLSVILLSNLMAMLLQALTVKLGVATGRDLAQACRDHYSRPVSFGLWILCEIAIIACDLAEVIGSAIALNLLFGIPMLFGVIITAVDVLLILLLQNKGFRYLEAFVIALIATIGLCFAAEMLWAQPAIADLLSGLVPRTEVVTNPAMLYIAMGILGATVMPHNLYLHSGIVQTRAIGRSEPERRQSLKYATWDSTIALMFALTINASILILAAATFHRGGHTDVSELARAQELLQPLLGASIAPTLFGLALLCCGLASTVTATMAGQIVMEGFLDIRLPAWLRRLVTRLVAIVPAIAVTIIYGDSETAKLLILSQVILSLQLPFAIVPLVTLTASRAKMGSFVAPRWLTAAAGVIAAVVIALNLKLLYDVFTGL